jgi:DNA-directed RNA polymerase II subunit RPB3
MTFANKVEKEKLLTFDISNIDVSIVNALRRVIISEVPTVAFAFDPTAKANDITIKVNTGSLHNEFLAHRISLIPLHFNKEETENFQPDKYVFVLHKKNTTESMMNVTTADIEILDETGKRYPDDFHARIFPSNKITGDHILITRLKPNLFNIDNGDEIDIEMKASVNSGKVHSRWTPTSLCVFENILDDNDVEEGLKAYIKKHENSGLDELELRNRFNTLEKYRFFQKNEFLEPCAFRFSLESECGLPSSYIVRKGLMVLVEKLKTFIHNLEEKNDIDVQQSQEMSFMTVYKEDHTLGNLVQAMLYNLYIRGAEDKDYLSYIGYYKPHPLEDHIIFKFRTKSGDPIKVMQQGCSKIRKMIEDIIVDWDNFIVS